MCHDQRNIFCQPIVITGALAVGILRKCQDEGVATGSVYHAYGHLKICLPITLLSASIVADLLVQLPHPLPPLLRVLLDPPQPYRLVFPASTGHTPNRNTHFSPQQHRGWGGTQLQVSSDTQLYVTPSCTLVSIWVPREGRAAIFLPGQCIFLCPLLIVF